ncbi:crossover junction endodeoxyribonuclease RuvC, partial [Candidatus Magnetaquicoccus inordinatus]|uniref:crossover junction endodeoxyribonuclease RuvC n=1 Tax=Candidatus Magnetaquicoccus inordinatus TaxID=2496818 RepID=UPI00187D21F9
ARGVAIAAANQYGVPIHEYTALQIKKAVVGYGRAEKQQMQEMVRIILGMAKPAAQDAADALGVAICHINHLPPARSIPPHPSTTGMKT